MTLRGDLVAACAETWIGVPFHWQGRVRAGCDCKGLVAGVAAELDFPEARSLEALAGDYGLKVPAARLRAGLALLFDRVAAAGRRPGDVLLVLLDARPQHLAIAAPLDGRPARAIEAMPGSAAKVRPATWPDHRVHSAWRWREPARPAGAG